MEDRELPGRDDRERVVPAPEVREAVRAVLRSVRDRPTELAVRDIAALHRTGHDVVIDTGGPETVAFVQPRPGLDFGELTARQTEVATLMIAGLSNRQIAATLSISPATVKDHVHAILDHTGMDSRSRLIATWYGGHRVEPGR